MPLDLRTLGEVPTRVGGYSPLKALANADTFIADQNKQREAQAEAAREQMIAQVVQQHPNDPDAAIAFLRPRDYKAAQKLEQQVIEHRTKLVELRGKELANDLNSGKLSKERAEAEMEAMRTGAFKEWLKLKEMGPEGAAAADGFARTVLGVEKWMDFQNKAASQATADMNADTSRMRAETSRMVAERPPEERGGTSDYAAFLRRYAASKGKALDQLTPAEELAARKQFSQADDSVRSSGGGVSTLSPAMESNIINRLTTQWGTAKKPAEELARQASLMNVGMQAAERGDLAAGSQAVLVTFQKILDPTSVVRESEYERSAAGQSLLNRVRGARDRLVSGGVGVPLAQLKTFKALADEAVKAQTGAYLRSTKERIGRTADRYKIPRDIVFEDVDVTTGTTAASGNNAGPKPTGRFNPATGKIEPVQ